MTATLALGSRKMWLAGTALFALGVMPAAANADHRHVAFGLGVGAVRADAWTPPVYETQARRVVVPAVYEDRTRRVWHEPVYTERRVAVQVPAEIIERRVAIYGSCGTVVGYRTVREVRPARTEWRTERVCVREGYFETVVDRVCVRPETARVVYDEVVVRPGYWTSPNRLEIHKDNGDRHFSFALGWGD